MVKFSAIPQVLKRLSISEDSLPQPQDQQRGGRTPLRINTLGGTEAERNLLRDAPLMSPLSQLSTPSVHLSKTFNFGEGNDTREQEYFGRMKNVRTPTVRTPASPNTPSYHTPQTPSFQYNKAFNFGNGPRSSGEGKKDGYFGGRISGPNTPGRMSAIAPETPSAYTDMYEYSVIGGPSRGGGGGHGNLISPRYERHLASNPPTPGSGRNSRIKFGRTNTSNTLGPDDSVSSYQIKAISRNLSMIPSEVDMGEDDPYSYQSPTKERPYFDASNRYGYHSPIKERPYFDASNRHSYRSGLSEHQSPIRPLSFYSSNHDGMSSRPYSYAAPPEPATPVVEPHELYDSNYEHKLYMSTGEDTLMSYHSGLNYAGDEDMKEKQDQWPDSSTSYHHQGPPGQPWDQNKMESPMTFVARPLLPDGSHEQIRRRSVEEGSNEEKGLLANLPYRTKGGVEPGWGGTLDEQIARRRRGVGRQKLPILTWILSIAYVVIFIVELVQSKQQTGQAIQTSPSVNPMLGPSFEFLISFGARFVPCMRNVPQIPTTINMACLRSSTSANPLTADQLCPIWEICGLPDANTTGQAYRFVTPIFIHAGLIHIAFNLMVQLTLCAQIEKLISTPFYAIVYLAGGIGGALLGGNFGLVGQPSVGASGAIYSAISVELIDLCYNWQFEYRPKMRLLASTIFAVIGFVIGLLPGLDNFAHIGGFAVGILGGLLFCPSIHATRRHQIVTWVLRIIAAGLFVGFCKFTRAAVATGSADILSFFSRRSRYELLRKCRSNQSMHLVSLSELVSLIILFLVWDHADFVMPFS